MSKDENYFADLMRLLVGIAAVVEEWSNLLKIENLQEHIC